MTPRRLLIVDDEEDIREGLREVFEDEGYEVATAANGREALQALRGRELPCGVILDLVMPVLSGNEVYDAVKADELLSSVPLLISTSDPSRAPPGSLVMKKPIDLEALIAAVARLCGRAHHQ